MNFMFSCQEQYLTRSLRSLVRYCSCHLNIKFISSRQRVISSIYFIEGQDKTRQLYYIFAHDTVMTDLAPQVAGANRGGSGTILLVQGLPIWAYTKSRSWGCSLTLVSCNLWCSAGEHFRPPAVHFVHKWPDGRSYWRREVCSLRRRYQAISKCLVYRTLSPYTNDSLKFARLVATE